MRDIKMHFIAIECNYIHFLVSGIRFFMPENASILRANCVDRPARQALTKHQHDAMHTRGVVCCRMRAHCAHTCPSAATPSAATVCPLSSAQLAWHWCTRSSGTLSVTRRPARKSGARVHKKIRNSDRRESWAFWLGIRLGI